MVAPPRLNAGAADVAAGVPPRLKAVDAAGVLPRLNAGVDVVAAGVPPRLNAGVEVPPRLNAGVEVAGAAPRVNEGLVAVAPPEKNSN